MLSVDISSLQTAALRTRDILALRATLSPDEVAKADRHRRPQDQVLSIAARGLLRQSLSRHFDTPPEAWRFCVDAFGKPQLSPAHGDFSVSFSVSHTDGLVVCAISRIGPIGIDAEAIEDPLAAGRADEPGARSWTAREAIAKALGRGLQLPFERIQRVAADEYQVDLSGLDLAEWRVRWRVVHPALSPQHQIAVAVPWLQDDPDIAYRGMTAEFDCSRARVSAIENCVVVNGTSVFTGGRQAEVGRCTGKPRIDRR